MKQLFHTSPVHNAVMNPVRPFPSQLCSSTFPLLKSHFPPGGVTLSSAQAKMTEAEHPANKIYLSTPTFCAEFLEHANPPPLGTIMAPTAPIMTSVHPPLPLLDGACSWQGLCSGPVIMRPLLSSLRNACLQANRSVISSTRCSN